MPSPILINGKSLVLNGITGNVGDKQGVASITVPVVVDSLVECFTISALDVADALGISGLICTDRPISELEYGGFEIRFQFEGFNNEVSYEFGAASASYSFSPADSDEPIQSHPNFLYYKNTYGWDEQNQRFPVEYVPKTGSDATALSKTNSKTKSNPLAGTTDWWKAGGVFAVTFAVTSVPADIYKGVGTLVDYPPGAERLNIPRFKNRKWLKMTPDVATNEKGSGSAARITLRYRLTGITSGAEAILYNASLGQFGD